MSESHGQSTFCIKESAILAISGPVFGIVVLTLGSYKILVIPQRTFVILFFGTILAWLIFSGAGFLVKVSPLETIEVNDAILFSAMYVSGIAIVQWFNFIHKIQELEERIEKLSS